MLGQSPHQALWHSKYLSDLGDGRPGVKSIEAANHGDMACPVKAEDFFDDRILPVMRKIEIDIREFFQSHAVTVEESLEIKFKPHGTDIADSQAKADQRVGGAPACDPLDAIAATVLEEFPNS
jgi:hypothetical protein